MTADVELEEQRCDSALYFCSRGGKFPLALKRSVFKNHFEYTGCNRRNGPDFGRVFLMLNYTEKPQNTYIQS